MRLITQLDVNVACVTDRDIMPNCAPRICIDEKYTDDKDTWPEKSKRAWRAEADFSVPEAENHVKEIKEKADRQKVKTFVANHWTLEYDLAYIGLQNEEMKEILIDSVINVSYEKKNRPSKKDKLVEKINAYKTKEEKAAYFYSFFTSKKASKADFAQELAINLEKKYIKRAEDLKKVLPDYLISAIIYVTKG